MPDNIAVIEVLYKCAGVGDVKAGTAAIRESETAAKSVGGTMGDVGKAHENALGMSRREWMRTGSEAAFYARTALSSLGQVDKGISQSIGLVTQLGESFMFGGVVGVTMAAVSTAIGLLIANIQASEEAARKSREQLVAPFVATREALKQLADMDNPIDRIAAAIPVTSKYLQEYVQSSHLAAGEALELNDLLQRRTELESEILEKGKQASSFQMKLNELTQEERRSAEGRLLNQSLGIATGQLRMLGHELLANEHRQKELRSAIIGGTTELVNQQLAAEALARSAKTMSRMDDYYTRQQDMKRDASLAASRAFMTQKEAIEKLLIAEKKLVEGMVTQAMAPTTVTAEDMMAAQLGTYKDKADEFGRRLEAVIAGTDPNKYGARFRDQLKKALDIGLSPKELSEAFKDKSLFGMHPELIDDLWDFEAMGDEVEKQINREFGTLLLKGKGVSQFFERAKNDPVLDSKLKALAIETSEDLQKYFEDSGGLDISPKEAEDFIAKCQEIRGDIEANVGGDVSVNVLWNYVGGGNNTGRGTYEPTDTSRRERASGGSVLRGVSYLVGERGPELFAPDRSGYVYSTKETREIVNSPNVQMQVTVNTPMDLETLAYRLGKIYRRNRR